MTNPPEQVRWCDLGCGAVLPVGQVTDGKCPRCGRRTVDLGWRYRNKRGVMEYVSSWETLPKPQREAA